MRLGKYLSSLTKPELEEITTNANFTDDEQKIFELLKKDKCITEIAISLCVCERTINRRIKNIKSKISEVGGYHGKNNTYGEDIETKDIVLSDKIIELIASIIDR